MDNNVLQDHVQIRNQAIPGCINCTGLHPNETTDLVECYKRLVNPSKHAWQQQMKFMKPDIKKLYMNKSCSICGRTYDDKGEFDETWKLTAKRIKEEFDNAGVFGVDDKKIEMVVARCRQSVEKLFRDRDRLVLYGHETGDWTLMEKMTFAGQLALILTHAQEARCSKTGFNINLFKKEDK